MQSCNFTDKRQPQTAALVSILAGQRVEALKNTRQRKVRDPATAVGNLQRDPILVLMCTQNNRPVLWRKVDSVVE